MIWSLPTDSQGLRTVVGDDDHAKRAVHRRSVAVPVVHRIAGGAVAP
jgi:hypothetical protein